MKESKKKIAPIKDEDIITKKIKEEDEIKIDEIRTIKINNDKNKGKEKEIL